MLGPIEHDCSGCTAIPQSRKILGRITHYISRLLEQITNRKFEKDLTQFVWHLDPLSLSAAHPKIGDSRRRSQEHVKNEKFFNFFFFFANRSRPTTSKMEAVGAAMEAAKDDATAEPPVCTLTTLLLESFAGHCVSLVFFYTINFLRRLLAM